MALLSIVGTGGFARQILPLLERGAHRSEPPGFAFAAARFLATDPEGNRFFDHPLMPFETASAGDAYVLAISNGKSRAEIATTCSKSGMEAARLLAATARVSALAELGEGAIVCDYTVIEPQARLGRHVHANVFSFVAHECVVGDFVNIGPRATCNGNVHIGDFAYIGAGAVIRQGRPGAPLSIGEGAVVGMGAVVTKDVPAGSVVVGNPATPLSPS